MAVDYDVVAVGNAIIDIIAGGAGRISSSSENIEKDSMTLIDEARADHLTEKLTDATVAPAARRRTP